MTERICAVQKTHGRRAESAEIVFHDFFPIHRQVDCFSHAHIAEGKTSSIQSEVMGNRGMGGVHGKTPITLQFFRHNRRKSAQIQNALYFSRLHRRVPSVGRRDGPNPDLLCFRLFSVVPVKTLNHSIGVGHPLLDHKGARPFCHTRPVPRGGIKTPGAEHGASPARHTVNEHGYRLFKIQMKRVFIIRFRPEKPGINTVCQKAVKRRRAVSHIPVTAEIFQSCRSIEQLAVMKTDTFF